MRENKENLELENNSGNSVYLSNIVDDWCNVEIGNFKGNVSSTTDLSFDFLYAFRQWIDNKCIPIIVCDEEDSEFRIIVEEYKVYIIEERESLKLHTFYIEREKFVSTILRYIENNLDDFANFVSYECDEEEILQRKIDLLTDIKYIKEHLIEF